MQTKYVNPTGGCCPPKQLFVNSGSPKKRLAFEVASRLGIETYLLNSVPGWADDYTRKTIYTQNLSLNAILDRAADLHRQVNLDGVVTFWEEDVPTCALVAERLGLPGNMPQAAMNARSKYEMRMALAQGDVPVPPFQLVTDEASLVQACNEIPLPAVLKPEWGADSEWVTRIDTVEQALSIYREIRSVVRVQDSVYPYPPARFILEGFMAGPEVSVEGVVQDGRVTLYAIIDKAKMDDTSFIERGESTPSRFPRPVQKEILEMVTRGVGALGLTHSGIHAEVKITPFGPRIVEIGARMGGDCIQPLVKRVYGIDLAEENIRVSLGLPARAARSSVGYGLSGTLVPERPGWVTLKPLRQPRRQRHLIEVVLTKHDGDQVQVPPTGYDNLAWVSVWGKSSGAAKRSLDLHMRRLKQAFVIHPQNQSQYQDLQLAD